MYKLLCLCLIVPILFIIFILFILLINSKETFQTNTTKESDLVSVIIPTYNRFKYILNAIQSVKDQTYQNIEIIVVNDASTQKEYYDYDWSQFGDNFNIIHLKVNSRKKYGKVAGGSDSRNIGMKSASGKYIAFLDDDDYFLPTKLEKQIKAMKKYNCAISCTEGYGGHGPYNKKIQYNIYHYKGIHWSSLNKIFKKQDKIDLLYHMYKNDINIWGKEEINTHNSTCGGSSIVIEKNLIDKAGFFPLKKRGEDWAYWKKLINYSNCVFLREPLTYIDLGHGDGKNY